MSMKEDWRGRHWFKALTILEAVLSVIMLIVGHFILNSDYFRGVGVGLLIAWVTGAIAYWRVMR